MYSSEYTSGFSAPAASHFAAPPSPHYERQYQTGSWSKPTGIAPTIMGLITPKTVAEKIADHLHYELSLDSLIAWAESALMDGEFDSAHLPAIRDVVARIGVADVRAFGLTWEDCEQLLSQLGSSAQVIIVLR
jgi:hypothetical protein